MRDIGHALGPVLPGPRVEGDRRPGDACEDAVAVEFDFIYPVALARDGGDEGRELWLHCARQHLSAARILLWDRLSFRRHIALFGRDTHLVDQVAGFHAFRSQNRDVRGLAGCRVRVALLDQQPGILFRGGPPVTHAHERPHPFEFFALELELERGPCDSSQERHPLGSRFHGPRRSPCLRHTPAQESCLRKLRIPAGGPPRAPRDA